jgi:hypothetical protein
VLLHGGSPKGAELIASKWASSRKVPQIAFKPDWTKHQKAAIRVGCNPAEQPGSEGPYLWRVQHVRGM